MPTCLLERYVGEMDRLEGEWLLDMATANDYAQWSKASREKWWTAQERRVRRQAQQGMGRGKAALLWNGEPVALSALKRNLFGALGGGFSRD
jgi:hypothetical protein